MSRKIIVMGGSFNPPTKAHFRLMQSAVDQLTTGASDESVKGVFVPSSDAYVSRKMSRQPSGADKTVLPEKLRYPFMKKTIVSPRTDESLEHQQSRATRLKRFSPFSGRIPRR